LQWPEVSTFISKKIILRGKNIGAMFLVVILRKKMIREANVSNLEDNYFKIE
jgi:hypothetical protein